MSADTETLAAAKAEFRMQLHNEIVLAMALFDNEKEKRGAVSPETRTHLKQLLVLGNSHDALPDDVTEELIAEFGLASD